MKRQKIRIPQREGPDFFFGAKFDGALKPISGDREIPHLTGVTREIVGNDGFLGKLRYHGQQRRPGFLGPLKFVQGVTLVNPSLHAIRGQLGKSVGHFQGIIPAGLLGIEPPPEFQDFGMIASAQRHPSQLQTRFDRVTKLQPAFRRRGEVTVGKIQFAHAAIPLLLESTFGKMVLRMRTLLLAGLVGWGLAQADPIPPATTVNQLQDQFRQVLSATSSPGAAWGIQVNSRRTGATWFGTNTASRFIPASNTKLFTAALALDRLGGDYRFSTSLRIQSPPNAQGVLAGDLLVVGGGDPTRAARLNGGSWEKAFAPLVAAVQARGIRRIKGNLLCDESRFRGPPYGSGWGWDDLAQYYGAAVSALTAEDNSLQVSALPGSRVGDPARLELLPLTAGLTLVSTVTTGPTNALPRLEVARLPGERVLEVSGTVPLGSERAVEEAAVADPARWFGELFREAMRRQGITVDGEIRVLRAADRIARPLDESTWTELAAVPSPAVGEVVREMMKPSQNLYAQLLWLAAGSEAERYPREGEEDVKSATTTEEAGQKVMNLFLQRHGFPAQEVVLEEGSGLSRKNLVSPRAVIQLLELMPRHAWGEAWMASLPVGGVDGSLKRRFLQPPTRGNVQAKTGTLRYVNSLSGYLTNSVGEPLVFSILINNFVPPAGGRSSREEMDQLVELLAQSQIR